MATADPIHSHDSILGEIPVNRTKKYLLVNTGSWSQSSTCSLGYTECIKFVLGRGSAPTPPAGGAQDTPPHLVSWGAGIVNTPLSILRSLEEAFGSLASSSRRLWHVCHPFSPRPYIAADLYGSTTQCCPHCKTSFNLHCGCKGGDMQGASKSTEETGNI